MTFWLFIAALGVLLLVGAVFEGLFWWSMTAFCVLWAVAVVVEMILVHRQERALSRQGGETPAEAPAAMSPTPTAEVRK